MNAAATMLRPLLLVVVAVQALNLIREQGLGMTLGTLLLGVVLGRSLTPLARARPLLSMLIYSTNAAVALSSLMVRTSSMELVNLMTNIILLLLVLDDPWTGWGRKLSLLLRKAGFRFTRPVIMPLT